MAARQRRNRMLVRGGGIALAGGALIALSLGAIIAVAPRARSNETAPAASGVRLSVPQVVVSPAKKVAAVAQAPASEPPPAPTPVPATQSRPQVVAQSAMADGRIALGDSVFAERAGSEVTVHFDNAIWRTRFEEKFERLVRNTLPALFGADAKAALDSVPPGQLVRGGDLIRDLPARGIPLAHPVDGQVLTIFPITRPGEAGPLVIAYRATLSR
jgi:hypothetical protein